MSAQGILYNIQRMSVHDGPGLRTTVFFKGCPLRCLWCSNPESQSLHPQLMFFRDLCNGCGRCLQVCRSGAVVREGAVYGRDFSKCVHCGICASECPATASVMSGRAHDVESVMKVIRKDAPFYANSGGGVTFSGGECTMQEDFLLALMESCQKEGLHMCVDTCGHTEPGLFGEVLERADLLLFDMKHMDSGRHKALTGVGNGRILENLAAALRACPEKIRIRIPLMPGLNDSQENILAVASFLRPYGLGKVDVLPCHAFGRNKYAALNLGQPPVREYAPQELRDILRRFAEAGLETEIV